MGNFMSKRNFWYLAALPLLLSGCLEDKKCPEEKKQIDCFEVIPESKTLRPIMVNKCTGETWMLVYTSFVDEKGNKTGTFTYRWSPLSSKNYGEPELSYTPKD